MAMPASGILRLSGCSQSCGSIMRAACGSTATAPVCLTALATAAGKASCMSAFYSYDDTMVVTPTSFTSIPNTCVTCSVTTCAPAFNTACVCTSCSWLVPATPVTPAPAGNSHNVVVCANAGAARCGTVCYVSVCGGNCAVTLCQVAGVTFTSISMYQIAGSGCGTAYATNTSCLTPPISVAGDCYCVCFCTHMCVTTAGVGCSQITILRNGTPQLTCCITAGQACVNPSVSFLVCCGQAIITTILACKCCGAGKCGSSVGCVVLNSITKVVGCYCIGSTISEIAATW
jgi:hypothetical protein